MSDKRLEGDMGKIKTIKDIMHNVRVQIMTDIMKQELETLIRHVELGEVSARWAVSEAARRGMELAKAIYR